MPCAAIVTAYEGSAVYLVTGGLAQRRAVSVVEWPAARLIVTKGLAPGDVVIADATGITEGLAVTAVKP